MANITLRDIPDDVLEQLRILSRTDRRSLNSELLHALEAGLDYLVNRHETGENPTLSREIQLDIWADLDGKWKDESSTFEEMVTFLYDTRTDGREVQL